MGASGVGSSEGAPGVTAREETGKIMAGSMVRGENSPLRGRRENREVSSGGVKSAVALSCVTMALVVREGAGGRG